MPSPLVPQGHLTRQGKQKKKKHPAEVTSVTDSYGRNYLLLSGNHIRGLHVQPLPWIQVSKLLVFNAQPTGTVISRRSLDTSNFCFFVGCLTSHQHASVSQGRICSDNFTCCHTKIEVADPTSYLTQSQYTDTGPTSPSADPITPGAWQGSHWSANFWVTGMTRPGKNPSASGIRTRHLPLSRRTPYHQANEAVGYK